MTDFQPERGTKRICPSCESRFYDLGRTPVICPKCGVEYVEPVRPPPAYQARRRPAFGKGGFTQPIEAEEAPAPAPASEEDEDEEREPDEDREEELDGESDSEAEHEPSEE